MDPRQFFESFIMPPASLIFSALPAGQQLNKTELILSDKEVDEETATKRHQSIQKSADGAGPPAADLSFASSQDSDRIQIAKLLKYAQRGNPTATMLALTCLRDLGLDDEFRQIAVLVRLPGPPLLKLVAPFTVFNGFKTLTS
jgi:hypothetical protein